MSPDMRTIDSTCIYMGWWPIPPTRRCCSVNSTTIFGYMAYMPYIHSCIWIYVDIVTTGPIHILINGFIGLTYWTLLLFREERCTNVISKDESLWYIVLPSNTLTPGTSTIPSPNTGEVRQLSPCLTYQDTGESRRRRHEVWFITEPLRLITRNSHRFF